MPTYSSSTQSPTGNLPLRASDLNESQHKWSNDETGIRDTLVAAIEKARETDQCVAAEVLERLSTGALRNSRNDLFYRMSRSVARATKAAQRSQLLNSESSGLATKKKKPRTIAKSSDTPSSSGRAPFGLVCQKARETARPYLQVSMTVTLVMTRTVPNPEIQHSAQPSHRLPMLIEASAPPANIQNTTPIVEPITLPLPILCHNTIPGPPVIQWLPSEVMDNMGIAMADFVIPSNPTPLMFRANPALDVVQAEGSASGSANPLEVAHAQFEAMYGTYEVPLE